MKKELKSLLSHKEKNNFSSPDIFSVLNLSLNPARCRLNWCVPSADQQAAALLCNPDSCLVEHIITVCHQPSRKSALAAQPSWEASCPSVAHEQKQRSCLRALNQVRLANPPSLLLAILHCLSKYTRPVVRRQHHLTGCEAAHCMTFFFFYYHIRVSSSPSKCTGPIKFSRCLWLLDSDTAAAEAANAKLLTWRWADFCLLLTAAKSSVGGSGAGGQRLCTD